MGKPLSHHMKQRPLRKEDREETDRLFEQLRSTAIPSSLFDDGWYDGWMGKPMNGHADCLEWRIGWRIGKRQRKKFDEEPPR
jgi:hypothetical protein